jgi:NAD+ kinase
MKKIWLIILCCLKSSSFGYLTCKGGATPEYRTLHPKNIGFFIKLHEPKADTLARTLAQVILKEGSAVFFTHENATVPDKLSKTVAPCFKSQIHTVSQESLIESTDLILVLGGDGTLLSTARLMKKKSVPVLGINMGHLGFLAAASPQEAVPLVQRILRDKKVAISQRTLCEVSLVRKGTLFTSGLAVNDALISRETRSPTCSLDLVIDGEKVYTLHGDGLMVSTPTGASGYSLSAGGPLIVPSLPVLVITPLCPHGLNYRPIVISDTSDIEVKVTRQPGQAFLMVDGRSLAELHEGDRVRVERYKNHTFPLVEPFTKDYFTVLREKLHFAPTC